MLGGYEQAVRLAALLRLEGLCEALVAGLAAATGLSAPAPHSSAAEAKQVGMDRLDMLWVALPDDLFAADGRRGTAVISGGSPQLHKGDFSSRSFRPLCVATFTITLLRWLHSPSWCRWVHAVRQACWARAGSSYCAR